MSIDTFLLSSDTTDLNYPEVRPTLDLNFARVKALDPRITFTRASGGSYVGSDGLIKFTGVNEARFDHDPYTGESLGLLVEESRTNLFEWSETFVSGWGGGLNVQVNTDTILNPYGVLGTVYYITLNEWTREFNANGLSTLALSFFSKRRFGGLNRDFSYIEIFQQAVGGGSLGSYSFRFDGNNPNSGQFQNIRTERYQNDWYRFSCTLVARPDYNGGVFATNARIDLEGAAADNYFWGIQVESGAFATSYIPTAGSTRTRAADNAQITGKNFSSWYRQDEGSVYSNITVNDKIPFSKNSVFYSLNDGSQSNRITLFAGNDSASLTGRYSVSGVLSSPILTSLTSPKNIKTTFSFQSNNIILLDNQRTSNLFPSGYPTVNRLELGNQSTAQFLNGTIRRLTYYPKRLPNQQLQALTR